MNKTLAALILLVVFYSPTSSQRILFQSDFENIPLVFPDSLPARWDKLDVDQNNPVLGWAVNDTNQHFGGDTSIFKPRAHSGKKCLFIFWLAGLGNNNLNDDWVWTDSIRILSGDSLIFWCLLGSTPLIVPYPDSVQIHVCTAQNPNSSILKLATIKSNDSAGIPLNNNVWTQHKFNLSQFNGQRIYIAWRYYMVISQSSGLWINIDDVFIGNRNAIGIIKIKNEVPSHFQLAQNYPNPFNPFTIIRFEIPPPTGTNGRLAKLFIYDILGREISMPVNEELSPGSYQIDFNGTNLASGFYYYRLLYDGQSITRKMILSK